MLTGILIGTVPLLLGAGAIWLAIHLANKRHPLKKVEKPTPTEVRIVDLAQVAGSDEVSAAAFRAFKGGKIILSTNEVHIGRDENYAEARLGA